MSRRFERLVIPHRLLNAVLAQARAELPNECCGLLAGRIESGVGLVTNRCPLVNAAESPATRYVSSPESMFAAMRELRSATLEVLAIYHSHPTSPAWPSRVDRELNYASDVANLIVSLAVEPPEWGLFFIDGDDISSLPLEFVQQG